MPCGSIAPAIGTVSLNDFAKACLKIQKHYLAAEPNFTIACFVIVRNPALY